MASYKVQLKSESQNCVSATNHRFHAVWASFRVPVMPPAASKPPQPLELLGSRMPGCVHPEKLATKKTVPKEIPASPENAFGLVSSCFLFLLKYPAYPVLPVFVANTGVLEVQPMIASAVASEERRRSTFIFCYFKRISVVVGRWLLVAGCWLLVGGRWLLVGGR